MELFFPETSITIRLSRLTTRSGRNALGTAAPPHFSQLTEGRASRGPRIGASSRSTANSALTRAPDRGPVDYPAVALRRLPYQLREARKEASASVWLTLNSERERLNLFWFAGRATVLFLLPSFYYIGALG